jgi:hypothetical protein
MGKAVKAESGCEILSDDGNGRVAYTLKCNHCGATDRSTRHDTVSGRNVKGPHRCAKCGKQSDVVLSRQ